MEKLFLYLIIICHLPLLNDTLARVDNISKYLQQQFVSNLHELFLNQVNEARANNQVYHLIGYVKFYDGMSLVKEILFCKQIVNYNIFHYLLGFRTNILFLIK